MRHRSLREAVRAGKPLKKINSERCAKARAPMPPAVWLARSMSIHSAFEICKTRVDEVCTTRRLYIYDIPITAAIASTRFHMRLAAMFVAQFTGVMRPRIMSSTPRAPSSADALQDAIGRADGVTFELMSAVLDFACARSAAPYRVDRLSRIRQLIESQAWIDAALALIELDRSRTVRRIAFDDGEWCCVLGSQWPVPEWLDEAVVFSHPVLPLAILGAFLGAVRQSPSAMPSTTSVPQSRPDMSDAAGMVSCDNFA